MCPLRSCSYRWDRSCGAPPGGACVTTWTGRGWPTGGAGRRSVDLVRPGPGWRQSAESPVPVTGPTWRCRPSTHPEEDAMRVLHVIATPRGDRSNTLQVTDRFLAELGVHSAGLDIEVVDLFDEDLPALAGDNIETKYTLLQGQPIDRNHAESWSQIEQLIARFLAADAYVISSPMWNLSIPYALKYYIDCIVQPGYLFRFNDHGLSRAPGARQEDGLRHRPGQRLLARRARATRSTSTSPICVPSSASSASRTSTSSTCSRPTSRVCARRRWRTRSTGPRAWPRRSPMRPCLPQGAPWPAPESHEGARTRRTRGSGHLPVARR